MYLDTGLPLLTVRLRGGLSLIRLAWVPRLGGSCCRLRPPDARTIQQCFRDFSYKVSQSTGRSKWSEPALLGSQRVGWEWGPPRPGYPAEGKPGRLVQGWAVAVGGSRSGFLALAAPKGEARSPGGGGPRGGSGMGRDPRPSPASEGKPGRPVRGWTKRGVSVKVGGGE